MIGKLLDDVDCARLSAMQYRLLDAAAGEHTGILIALVPSADDAQRLALQGGEDVADLHVTLFYYGEARAMPLDLRRSLIHTVAAETARFAPLMGQVFGFGVFNPTGESPALILNVGGSALDDFRRELNRDVGLASSEQYRPWAPHLTLAYLTPESEPFSPAGLMELAGRMGSVKFDRVRIAFAGDAIDIPFTNPSDVAAAEVARSVYDASRAIVANRGAALAPRLSACKGSIVAPKVDGDQIALSVVAAVEGVRRPVNSEGPELVLAYQLEAALEGAIGMPVTFDHPQVTTAAGTEHVSIKDKRAFDANTGVPVGTVADARVDGDRMVVDVTASISALRSAGDGGNALADALLRGEQTEVSLAYFAVTVPASGVYEGEPYVGVHTEIAFDHLALLPLGVPGACSLANGCGTSRA